MNGDTCVNGCGAPLDANPEQTGRGQAASRVALILNGQVSTYMKMLVSLTRLRRCVAARAMAVFLLVLAVTPFTAPFATFDFADLAGDGPTHSDLLSSKAAKEALTAHVDSSSLTPQLVVLPVRVAITPRQAGSRQVLQTVLRL